jgi:hypothetical protein
MGWRQDFMLRGGDIPFNSVNDGFFNLLGEEKRKLVCIQSRASVVLYRNKAPGCFPKPDTYAQVLGEAIAVALARDSAGLFTADEKSRDVCPRRPLNSSQDRTDGSRSMHC